MDKKKMRERERVGGSERGNELQRGDVEEALHGTLNVLRLERARRSRSEIQDGKRTTAIEKENEKLVHLTGGGSTDQ
jgi:hypothetical protein